MMDSEGASTQGCSDDPALAQPPDTRLNLYSSVVKKQLTVLPFLRTSKTVRRNPPASCEKEDSAEVEKEEENSSTAVAHGGARQHAPQSMLETGQSVHDRHPGRLRSKTVTRNSFESFPGLISTKEELPHPSKLRSSKKGNQRKRKAGEANQVFSHLSQMKKRLTSWEDGSGDVLQPIRERRKRTMSQNVRIPNCVVNSVPVPSALSLPPHQCQSVLLNVDAGQGKFHDDVTRRNVLVSQNPSGPEGHVLQHEDLSVSSMDILPLPTQLQESQPVDLTCQWGLLPSASYPTPSTPVDGASAPDVTAFFSGINHRTVSRSQTTLAPVYSRLCHWIDQGNSMGPADVCEDDMPENRKYGGGMDPTASLTTPVKESLQGSDVKMLMLDRSQVTSAALGMSGSRPLDQASLWHCDTESEPSPKYPAVTGLCFLEEE